MNKLKVTFFVFIVSLCLNGQRNDSLKTNEIISSKFTEKDIFIDQIDTLKKVNFEVNYKNKYNSSEFDYEVKVPEKNWWERFQDWIAFLLRKIFNFSNINDSINYTQKTLKVIACIIIAVVAYFIVKLILNKEGNWIFGKSVKNKIEYDNLEQNLATIDFKKLVQQTLQSGNKRLVIRYYYLWILKNLSERELINFIPEKTNSDYYNELKSEKTKADFKYVSYLYNNIWYGEFEISDEKFSKAQQTFQKTLESI